MNADKDKVYKVSVNLSSDVYQALQEISKQRNVPMAQAIRQAIGTEKYLLDQRDKGSKILIKDKDRSMQEVILR